MSIDVGIAVRRSGIGGFDLPTGGVSLISMPLIVEKVLGSNIQAITIVKAIVIRADLFDRVVAGSEPELLAHELIHVAQWADHGVVPFAWTYARDYLRLRLLGASHDASYRSVGFEYQAYTGAREIKGSLA